MWDGTQDLGRFLIAHGVTEDIANYLKKTKGWKEISDLKNLRLDDTRGCELTRKEIIPLKFLSYWVKLEEGDKWTHEKESGRQKVFELWNTHRKWAPEREQIAQARLERRPDRSAELKSLLQEGPWECPICMDDFNDPSEINVTCDTEENVQRDSENAQRDGEAKVQPVTQHKACRKCCEHLNNLGRCHMCRRPIDVQPLTRFWNGHKSLNMMMGVANPYLVTTGIC
jgi:hypothetical protein